MNNKIKLNHVLVSIFLITCCLIAWHYKPKTTWFEHIGSPSYGQVIPHEFENWIDVSEQFNHEIIDPQQLYALNEIYTQIISRTYLHKPTGRKIMLSVAYGDNQSFSKQLHRPESCYSSQGYSIKNLVKEAFGIRGKSIELNRFSGIVNNRIEQVSYFIRIGDKVISGPAKNLNLARMGMGVKGYIADGLLFRVSEINDVSEASYQLQNIFITDLFSQFRPKALNLFI